MGWINIRLMECQKALKGLIDSQKYPFDNSIRSNLPDSPGIYAISSDNALSGEYIIAGRTKGVDGLRQRIYQNHLMGNQSGNLRSKLVNEGLCSDLEEVKRWIRENCVVQFYIIEDKSFINWAEHYVLSILRPKYND